MIIVTSKPIPIGIDYTEVYAIHFLKEIAQPIPWYVLQFGNNKLPAPLFISNIEGIYGIPLSKRAHLARVAINGQRWMEDISDELIYLLQEFPLSEQSTVGDDCPPPEELYKFISKL